jgi:hypothetical protein
VTPRLLVEDRRREHCRKNDKCPWCPARYSSRCGDCHAWKASREAVAAQPAQRLKRIVLSSISLVAMVLLVVFVFVVAPLGFLWMYAQWGAGCLERGGRIEGAAFETRCEDSK